MSAVAATKDERINVRVPAKVKRVLAHAAEATGRSLTDFIVASAYSAAQRAIEEVERLDLTAKDRAVFLDALADPPAPNKALKAAVRRYRAAAE